MRAREVVSLDNVGAPRGYNTVGARLLLMLGWSNLASCVAMGTLTSRATATLRAALSEGTGNDTIAQRSRIAVHSLMALRAMAGIVLPRERRMSNAIKTVMSSGEIVGVVEWLG